MPVRALLGSGILLAASSLAAPAQAGSFTDGFANGFDPSTWVRSTGYTNGSPFNVGWLADHVQFASDRPAGAVMRLRLDNTSSSGKRYSSGEYHTIAKLSYGTVSARLKPARSSGVVSSLFTYTGPAYGDPWDEIDLEFLGNDPTRMHLNYFTDGVGGHETLVYLGFDASLAYHDYAFTWEPGAISWYVDGRLVHAETGERGPLPSHPAMIFMNLWAGDNTTTSWLGPYRYSGPVNAYYDSVSYVAAEPSPNLTLSGR